MRSKQKDPDKHQHLNMTTYKHIYFSNRPGDIHTESAKILHNHLVLEHEGYTIIWPIKFDTDHVSPETILALKNEFKIDKILFVDKLKNIDGTVTITGHTNRSGMNFLRGKTPHGDLPRFPDMSRIYNPVPNPPKVTAHTVGPNRFKTVTETKTVWSESVGIIAPVLHYCGLQVYAIGRNPRHPGTSDIANLLV